MEIIIWFDLLHHVSVVSLMTQKKKKLWTHHICMILLQYNLTSFLKKQSVFIYINIDIIISNTGNIWPQFSSQVCFWTSEHRLLAHSYKIGSSNLHWRYIYNVSPESFALQLHQKLQSQQTYWEIRLDAVLYLPISKLQGHTLLNCFRFDIFFK